MIFVPWIEADGNLLKRTWSVNTSTNRLLKCFQLILTLNFIRFFTFVLRICRFHIFSIYFYMDQTIFSSPLAMLHLSTPLGAYSTHRIKKASISACSALSIVVTRSYMLYDAPPSQSLYLWHRTFWLMLLFHTTFNRLRSVLSSSKIVRSLTELMEFNVD